MEVIKIILVSTFILLCVDVNAQQSKHVRKGLLVSRLTLAPSYIFSTGQSPFYLHGMSEIYVGNEFSLTGDGYFFIDDLAPNEQSFSQHHSLFFGGSKHYLGKVSDFYFGIQPGLSITEYESEQEKQVVGVNPLFSIVAGYNIFFSKYMHFFAQARFVAGKSNYVVQQSLSDIRISAGLGFHINTRK